MSSLAFSSTIWTIKPTDNRLPWKVWIAIFVITIFVLKREDNKKEGRNARKRERKRKGEKKMKSYFPLLVFFSSFFYKSRREEIILKIFNIAFGGFLKVNVGLLFFLSVFSWSGFIFVRFSVGWKRRDLFFFFSPTF